ncbi:MAG: hypothetical protein DLM58_16845 [Pseudonocardiales bacterium]|nr:MAG: hypothetical protein DLM58_16845 [Pseudonocardiales bacterium]
MADELDRWLAAARPHTAADDGWAASPAGDRTISAIRRANRRVTHLPLRGFWHPAQRIVLVAAAAILVVAIATPSGSDSGRPSIPPSVTRPANMALVAHRTCADLLADLRAHTAASVTPYGLPGDGRYATDSGMRSAPNGYPVPAATAGRVQSAPAHSTTNVHEAGVDEPDLVKTDGDRIVTVSAGVLRVIDTATKKITGHLKLPVISGWDTAQLLVAGDRALVLVQPSGGGRYAVPHQTGRKVDGASASPVFRAAPPITSSYLLVDLSGAPRVLESVSPNGQYVDARIVGSTIRLVVRSVPKIVFPNDYPGPITAARRLALNQAIVRKAPLSAWLPSYLTAGGFTRTVACSQISHPTDYTGTSMLTIYTVDLSKSLAELAPVSVAADGDTVYGTQSSLYIASNPNWWSCCVADVAAVPGGPATKPRAEKTELHRFDITGPGAPHYLGSGSVPGRLLNQYSLSDYDGHLRVATTRAANTWSAAGRTGSSNSVYVLAADTLAVTGHVGGLGQGEQIYAVRFIGPLGYVVTFRQTDPLYVLDLHNPTAPREVGELKLTGYSAYLHPVGDGRLLGVGQEANNAGRVAGLQVSLFDVSDASSPHRLAHVVRSDAPGEGQFDPHAFLYWPAAGLAVVPIQSWSGSASGQVLVLKVGRGDVTTVGLISHPRTGVNVPPDFYAGIQRSMVIGSSIWTLSAAGLKVSDLTTLADEAWIPFG